MWHFLMLAIAYACILASPAEAAPKKKGPPPDPFKACDLQVRADLREGGTWLIPRDIRLDEARLMLSVTFSPEKSIRSVPKVLYGNSDEEKRRQLRGYLEEMKAAVDAATKESAWFVVASKRTLPPELRSSEGDSSPWYGILLADIGGKCRSVAMFRNVQRINFRPMCNVISQNSRSCARNERHRAWSEFHRHSLLYIANVSRFLRFGLRALLDRSKAVRQYGSQRVFALPGARPSPSGLT